MDNINAIQTFKPVSQTDTSANTPQNSISETADESTGILEAIRSAREQAEHTRDQFRKLPKPVNYSNAALEAYSRLASARSPAQASAAAGYARRRTAQLKTVRDTDNARQIQTVIRQLEKAAQRAVKKRTQLEKEQLDELKQKKLQAEEQRQKAMRLRQELKARKSRRAIRESGYFRELEIENRFQSWLTQTEMELREQVQSLSDTAAPPIDTTAYAAQTPVSTSATEISAV